MGSARNIKLGQRNAKGQDRGNNKFSGGPNADFIQLLCDKSYRYRF